ncbi:MAG: decarboxylating 6-phosphogluconate dehydrogenase [Saprospiraceae bacterium]|nr:decarboxylating 6-phosphogluconate dehydrogenase [Saprospiraceae bacterium]
MTIGLIGLGKMGFPLAQNMLRNKFTVVAFDIDDANRKKSADAGIVTTSSIQAVAMHLPSPRIVWSMVPAGLATESVLAQLPDLLSPGDIVIDGGNSNYKDTLRHYAMFKEHGIRFLDCGTSGGTSGALNGACTMIGGDKDAYEVCKPLFDAISIENGSLYVGAAGSGHFTKMVHNGIEYGMMQSIAEGFEVLNKSQFDVDFEAIAKVWNHGSVVRSWLMELTQNAFSKDPKLASIKGIMHASGEGKWTIETALDLGVPTPVIALSLLMRFRSQEEDTFGGKVVAALRNEFGGHAVERAG